MFVDCLFLEKIYMKKQPQRDILDINANIAIAFGIAMIALLLALLLFVK
jgi:hypothetical protein